MLSLLNISLMIDVRGPTLPWVMPTLGRLSSSIKKQAEQTVGSKLINNVLLCPVSVPASRFLPESLPWLPLRKGNYEIFVKLWCGNASKIVPLFPKVF